MLIVTIFVCNLVITSYGRVLETEFSPRIVNGENATLGEIPYQVSIQRSKDNSSPTIFHHFCGGSIYNENFVITAAHCLRNLNMNSIQVVDGIVDLQDRKSVHLVSEIIMHDGYDLKNSYVHDIALIKVATPFTFSKTVSPVALPKSNSKVSVNNKAIVSGWGDTLDNVISPSRFLKKVTILIADQDYCRNAYIGRIIHETQICAHDPVVEHGSCHGDSGGPLTVDGVLVGIVSWAHGCAQVNYPSVFTRVPKYIDWIHEHAI